MEYQIGDRLSFMKFLGLELGDEIPDANTIWDFKELIDCDGHKGSEKLFDFHSLLEAEGLIAKQGSIIDASFVEAPKQRNTRSENKEIKEGRRPEGFEEGSAKSSQKDCDALWTKKNNETHYGYKNHTKVDVKSKLIDSHATTLSFRLDLNENLPKGYLRCAPVLQPMAFSVLLNGMRCNVLG